MKKAIVLERINWTIVFTWIMSHAGNYGEGFADKVAKEAARKYDISFYRNPISEIYQRITDQIMATWQTHWNRTTNALPTKEHIE